MVEQLRDRIDLIARQGLCTVPCQRFQGDLTLCDLDGLWFRIVESQLKGSKYFSTGLSNLDLSAF